MLPSHCLPTWVSVFQEALKTASQCVLLEELAIVWFMCGCALTRGRKREGWRGQYCEGERDKSYANMAGWRTAGRGVVVAYQSKPPKTMVEAANERR